jgi:hypothetical protein
MSVGTTQDVVKEESDLAANQASAHQVFAREMLKDGEQLHRETIAGW